MISFIIPVYNKGEIIYKTLSSLCLALDKSRFNDYEIILVSDGSTDNSFREALRFKKKRRPLNQIKIFHYTKNIGKGFALRFGFFKSSGETVVFLDGDMDISSRQVVRALTTYASQLPDMVIGSKYLPTSRTYYPTNRFVYSLILRQTIGFLFNLNVSDTQVGLKIFEREVLSEILPRLVIKRFAMDLEMLVVAQILGYTNIIETPVHIKQRGFNNSSVNFGAVKNFVTDIAAIFYRKNILHYYEPSKKYEWYLPPSFTVTQVS